MLAGASLSPSQAPGLCIGASHAVPPARGSRSSSPRSSPLSSPQQQRRLSRHQSRARLLSLPARGTLWAAAAFHGQAAPLPIANISRSFPTPFSQLCPRWGSRLTQAWQQGHRTRCSRAGLQRCCAPYRLGKGQGSQLPSGTEQPQHLMVMIRCCPPEASSPPDWGEDGAFQPSHPGISAGGVQPSACSEQPCQVTNRHLLARQQ